MTFCFISLVHKMPYKKCTLKQLKAVTLLHVTALYIKRKSKWNTMYIYFIKLTF